MVAFAVQAVFVAAPVDSAVVPEAFAVERDSAVVSLAVGFTAVGFLAEDSAPAWY